ncbi:MAG: YtxH domain-containing protein [Sphingobacteriaceae bacterium]
MSDNSKIAVALLSGLAVGAAVGILFAPERGSETRSRLSNALKDLGDSIKDLASEGIDELHETTEKVAGAVKSKMKSAQDQLDQASNQAGV